MAKKQIDLRSQDEILEMVNEEVTPVIQTQLGPQTPVQEALVRAIYSPDRRLRPA